MRTLLARIILLFSLAAAIAACGYRFTPVGGIVPESARAIAILTFINGTAEPYLDVEITRAVVDEFLADGRLTVTGKETADLILKGVITRFEITPLSYTPDSFVQQYQVGVVMDVLIEDGRTGKVIWQERGLGTVLSSSYPVALGNISATKTLKERAIRNAGRDIASTLRSRVLEGF